tara:strand:+ start:1136 stop:1813 length:678 start_codon:yes stop_codon:yes gene_type:complete
MKFGHYTDKGLPESEVGYRCPSWNPMPPGKKNVVVLGCSHTYGVGLEDNEHWVHFLSQHNTDRLRYWNLGQPGASADQIVRILYGTEHLLFPEIVIVCWPLWSRRERLEKHAISLHSDNEFLKIETGETDKQNFLKNVFHVEKFAEKNRCKTLHCFADQTYQEHIKGLNVLEDYTIRNCWPYWDKFEQRVPYNKPSIAKDGWHFGIEHHQQFAKLFLGYFGRKLR